MLRPCIVKVSVLSYFPLLYIRKSKSPATEPCGTPNDMFPYIK